MYITSVAIFFFGGGRFPKSRKFSPRFSGFTVSKSSLVFQDYLHEVD